MVKNPVNSAVSEFNLSDYSELVTYYDGIAAGYNELHFQEQMEKMKILKEHLSFSKASEVLDVGCGTFFSSEFFGCDMRGIEPSAEMVHLFVKEHPQKADRIFVGFAEEIAENFSGKCFDGIICVSAAHHFHSPADVFSQMKNICKKEALFGITLLKNSSGYDKCRKALKGCFDIVEEIDSSKDSIFICKNKD